MVWEEAWAVLRRHDCEVVLGLWMRNSVCIPSQRGCVAFLMFSRFCFPDVGLCYGESWTSCTPARVTARYFWSLGKGGTLPDQSISMAVGAALRGPQCPGGPPASPGHEPPPWGYYYLLVARLTTAKFCLHPKVCSKPPLARKGGLSPEFSSLLWEHGPCFATVVVNGCFVFPRWAAVIVC